MRIIHLAILFIISLALFLPPCFNVYAFGIDSVGYAKLSPASPFYFLEVIRESVEMKLSFKQPAKIQKQIAFSQRRIQEVNSLALSHSQDLIAQTLENYKSNLSSIPQVGGGDALLADQLADLLAVYPQVINTQGRMAIRAVVNLLGERADLPKAIKLPACAFLAQEASSSALNDTEKFTLIQRAKQCQLRI